MTAKRIFLTDHDELGREDIGAVLRAHGYDVAAFAGGDEAIAAARARPPDLFITSMGLDGAMDGLQYTRALKADDALSGIPVILLTGSQRVMHLPFRFSPDPQWFPVADVVEKPARPDYLFEVIEKALTGPPAVISDR